MLSPFLQMNHPRSILRHLINQILRMLATNCGKPLPMMDRIVIISPHPDDEILGCGGIISRLNKLNKQVFIVFLTKGENCDPSISPEVLMTERRKLTDKALERVGQAKNRVYFLNFKDGQVHIKDPETEKLRFLLNEIEPQAIFVTHQLEGWNDHVQAYQIIKTFIKNKDIRLFEYCVWFWFSTPFLKALFIKWKNARIFGMDATENAIKKEAIDIYMKGKTPEGLPYSGNLPTVLLKNCSHKNEIYFEDTTN